ncbi:mucin-1-like isoform X1 [Gallus gallus]|uniref:mucin-1-like isoform X1 n=1 Tax=Gallus gallus TaxID=9031 RepID=UPI001F005007|nr:mucin-1-like isoform X1 [Gallus gallus]
MNRWNNTQAGNRESKRVPRAAEGRGTTSSQALPSKLSELSGDSAGTAGPRTHPAPARCRSALLRFGEPRSPPPLAVTCRPATPGPRVARGCLPCGREAAGLGPATSGRGVSAALSSGWPSPRDPQHQGFATRRPPPAIAEGNNGTLGTGDSREEETQEGGGGKPGAEGSAAVWSAAERSAPLCLQGSRGSLAAAGTPPPPHSPPRPSLQLSRAPGAAKQRRFCDRVTAKWCDIRGGRRSSSRGGRALPGPSAATGRGSARRHRTAPRPSARRDPHER